MTEKISVDEIKKIAELSRIKLTDEEAATYSKQFEDIIPFIGQISNLETSKNVVRDFKRRNILRDDVAKETNNQKEILGEMPDTHPSGYLKVKKILNN